MQMERIEKLRRDLNGLGVIGQASILRVGFGSAGVTDGGPCDPIQAAEHGLGSPEASESENRSFQVQRLVLDGGFGNPIRKSDALCFISHIEDQEKKD